MRNLFLDLDSYKLSVKHSDSCKSAEVQSTSALREQGGRYYNRVVVGSATFAGIALLGMSIGAAIGTYIFFGSVMLAGLVVVVENNKILVRIVERSNKTIDLLILTASVIATVKYSITISAALTIAGLGYTLVYSPYVRYRASLRE